MLRELVQTQSFGPVQGVVGLGTLLVVVLATLAAWALFSPRVALITAAVGVLLTAGTTIPAAQQAWAQISGDETPGVECTDVGAILATIRTLESGGNYTAKSPHATASGAYQFIDATWGGHGGYRRAMDAPPAVQDERAAEHVGEILAATGGDVARVPVAWYTGDPHHRLDVVPRPDAGNRLTVGEYQQRWLAEYERQVGECAPTAPAAGYALPLPADATSRTDWLDTHHDYPAVDLGTSGASPPVYAVHGGMVVRRTLDESNCHGNTASCDDICGLGLVIAGDDGVEYRYCHLSVLGAEIAEQVTTGQEIGAVGNTGNSSGNHLHFAMRLGDVPLCPQPLLMALLDDATPPTPADLPRAGCTHES